MATTRQKAEAFVKAMQKAESENLKTYGIDRNDVTVLVSVVVNDKVTYNNHEDED